MADFSELKMVLSNFLIKNVFLFNSIFSTHLFNSIYQLTFDKSIIFFANSCAFSSDFHCCVAWPSAIPAFPMIWQGKILGITRSIKVLIINREGEFQKKNRKKSRRVSHVGVTMDVLQSILYPCQTSSAIMDPIKTQLEIKSMLTIGFFHSKNDHN